MTFKRDRPVPGGAPLKQIPVYVRGENADLHKFFGGLHET